MKVLTVFLQFLFISFIFSQSCTVNNDNKVDCGAIGTTQSECQNSGCCWQELNNGSSTPWCYYPVTPVGPFNGPPFNETAMQFIWKYFTENLDIQGKGGVVASPDNNTPGGSYYFHWMRDGALSMDAYMMATNFSYHENLMKSYVSWILNNQGEGDPNGIDVRIEPKFDLPNGNVYTGAWCRPQTDGPALRVITLTRFADELLSNGQVGYIKDYLWTGDSNTYNGGAIKYDLDWVVNNWQQNGCDLWEEIESNDFFWNRMAFKKALLSGYEIALKFGDTSSANQYLAQAQQVNSTLPNHYNGHFVYESTNREEDAAVICAFNDGYSKDGLFGPTDYRVANTIDTLNNLFYNTFPINKQDTNKGVPGVLYGRYQGDTYAGGNPWILLTNALAQLYYRGASTTLQENRLPEEKALQAFAKIFKRDIEELKAMTPFEFATLTGTEGDNVLYRIRYHVEGDNYHMAEQLDKNTGFEISATDLTWSYATAIKAMVSRNGMSTIAQEKFSHEIISHNKQSFFKKVQIVY
eukprot:TRINITY_DN2226_c0_g1_i1.p1 TRINITY_DN2226_c0_g1~~TRINITY_DN2226_c0_g1_i1.p1  ORF type:complete len:530 (-),score=189.50 TRINITY_DN2226_c0_g1_i1:146-1714(-)